MKLIIIRHANAQATGDSGDFSRDLSERGEKQAKEIAAFLASAGIAPDYAIVSAAHRTAQTFERLNVDCPADITRTAYNASAQTLAQLVSEAPEGASCVVLVAHNPGVTDLAIVCGHDNVLSTGAVVIVEWSGTALDFIEGVKTIRQTFTPRA